MLTQKNYSVEHSSYVNRPYSKKCLNPKENSNQIKQFGMVRVYKGRFKWATKGQNKSKEKIYKPKRSKKLSIAAWVYFKQMNLINWKINEQAQKMLLKPKQLSKIVGSLKHEIKKMLTDQ